LSTRSISPGVKPLARGTNATVKVQCAPAATLPEQLPLPLFVRTKFVDVPLLAAATLLNVNGALPMFVTLTVTGEDVLPSACAAKATSPGEPDTRRTTLLTVSAMYRFCVASSAMPIGPFIRVLVEGDTPAV